MPRSPLSHYQDLVATGRYLEDPAQKTTVEALDIDVAGLDTTDRRLLAAIVQKFGSGPVGGAAIAAVPVSAMSTLPLLLLVAACPRLALVRL